MPDCSKVIVQFCKCDNIVSQLVREHLPLLLADLGPDLRGELQLDRVDVAAVSGAVDLCYPASAVILVPSWEWLPAQCTYNITESVTDNIQQSTLFAAHRGDGTALYPAFSNIDPKLESPNKSSSTSILVR